MLSNSAFNALLKTLEEPPRARQVHLRHHRAAQAAGHRAVALPALRLPAHPVAAGRRAPAPDRATPRAIAVSDAALFIWRARARAACATPSRCSTRSWPAPAGQVATRTVFGDARPGRPHGALRRGRGDHRPRSGARPRPARRAATSAATTCGASRAICSSTSATWRCAMVGDGGDCLPTSPDEEGASAARAGGAHVDRATATAPSASCSRRMTRSSRARRTRSWCWRWRCSSWRRCRRCCRSTSCCSASRSWRRRLRGGGGAAGRRAAAAMAASPARRLRAAVATLHRAPRRRPGVAAAAAPSTASRPAARAARCRVGGVRRLRGARAARRCCRTTSASAGRRRRRRRGLGLAAPRGFRYDYLVAARSHAELVEELARRLLRAAAARRGDGRSTPTATAPAAAPTRRSAAELSSRRRWSIPRCGRRSRSSAARSTEVASRARRREGRHEQGTSVGRTSVKQAQELQERLAAVQEEAAAQPSRRPPAAAWSRSSVNGRLEVVASAHRSGGARCAIVEMLQDLVVAAVNQGIRAAQQHGGRGDEQGHRRPQDPRPELRAVAEWRCRAHALPPLARLIQELVKLPGIGEKTATRLAFHLLRTERARRRAPGRRADRDARRVRTCSACAAG